MNRQRERAARVCRLQMNRLRLGNDKINYLQDQKDLRKERNAPVKPYNWQDILQRSKMMVISSSQKPITYITHLQQNKAREDKPVKGPKKEHDNVPKNKRVKAADETRNLLIKHCVTLIKYISRLRKFSYVCQTEKRN